jgi:hypothetical protein
MPHAAEISRAAPSCFLFVVDQSGSMEDAFAGAESSRSKAQELADVINRLLQTLVTRCAQGEDVHDYFEIGVIGYGETVGPALQGPLAGRDLVKISELAFNPALLEQRTRTIPDGDGGTIEESYQFPSGRSDSRRWHADVRGLRRTKTALEAWVVARSRITDGRTHHRRRVDRRRAVRDRLVDSRAGHQRRSGFAGQPPPVLVRRCWSRFKRRVGSAGRVRADVRHVGPPARVRHEAGFGDIRSTTQPRLRLQRGSDRSDPVHRHRDAGLGAAIMIVRRAAPLMTFAGRIPSTAIGR